MPSPSPTSCLGQTGTSICVTPTHRGGSLLPSHVHGADPVTYVDAYLCCHPHSSAHNQMHTCVYMQAITHCHTPPGVCHRCAHHPGGTDFLVLSHKYTYSDATWNHPGPPHNHHHRWPLAPRNLFSWPARALPSHSPGPWAAGPARRRWTGAGTGSGCGLPASPASGSSQCPSPLSWHLLGPGRGGMSHSLAQQSHPQCRPLPKKR